MKKKKKNQFSTKIRLTVDVNMIFQRLDRSLNEDGLKGGKAKRLEFYFSPRVSPYRVN